MSIDWGFDFRNTDTFVTDPANCTYVIGTVDVYPTTRAARTFGFLAAAPAADRDAGVDARLAGINYWPPSFGHGDFQVDIVPDTYDVRLANGDTGGAQGAQYVEIFDNTTSLFVLDNSGGIAQDHYFDATNVDRAEADWPSQNAANTQSFESSVFILRLGNNGAGYTVIAHLRITTAAGGAAPMMGQIWL